MPPPPTAILERPLPREAVDEVARTLLDASPAGSRVILFGSYARGEAGPDSDLDFMILEPDPKNVWAESTRLRRALRHLRVPVDVLVDSFERYESWRTYSGTVHSEAHREGRVYGDA